MENGNSNGQANQNELTSKANSPNLNKGGDIFMSNPGGGEPGAGGGPTEAEVKIAEANAKAKDAEAIKAMEETRKAEAVRDTAKAEADKAETAERAKEREAREARGREPEEWRGEQGMRYTKEFYEDQYEKLKPARFKELFDAVSPYSTDGVDPGLIRFIATADDETLLYSFVNTIAALPLETELIDYDLGLYAGSAMSIIISELRPTFSSQSPWLERYGAEMGRIASELGPSSGSQSQWQRERFDKVTARVEAFKLLHQMNKNIITDAIDQFAPGSALITPSHLQTLLDIKGVPIVMRLFEPAYQSLLTGKDGRVTGKNEEMMLGKEVARNELSEAMASIGRARSIGSIEEQLMELVRQAKGYPNEKGEPTKTPNPYLSELADIQYWEIRLAVNAAKLLENLTLRSIEHIALNKVAPAPLKGFPKERATRIFSPILEIKRFKSGEGTGGMWYFDRVLKWYQKLREKQGYGKTHITKLFGGKDIGDYEAQGMFKAGSMFATWRGRGTIVEQAPMIDDGKLTSIDKYMHDLSDANQAKILENLGHPEMGKEWDAIKTKLKEEGFKSKDDPDATQEQIDAFDNEFQARFKAKFEERGRRKGILDKLSGSEFTRFNRKFERRKSDAQPELLREIFLAKQTNPDGSIKRNLDGSVFGYITVTNPDGSTGYELDSRFTNAYGSLLKLEDITPLETDIQVPGLLEAKAAVRRAILRRMTDENPMALAFLMAGMDFEGGAPTFHTLPTYKGTDREKKQRALDEFRLFARGLNPDEPDLKKSTSEPDVYTYRNLLTKLNLANEIRLSSIEQNALDMVPGQIEKQNAALQDRAEQLEGEGKIAEAQAIRGKIKDKPSPALSLNEILGKRDFQVHLEPKETELLEQIREYGRDVAGELTAIRFPYIPIMNDMTWGTVDFREGGAIYYSRQIGDDVGRFHAWKKIEPFQRSPTAFNPYDVIKIMKEAKEELTGPNGTEGAQDILLPFELAHWDMIQIGGQFGDWKGSGVLKFLAANLFAREIAHNTNLSNSIAQVWGGVDAPAFDVVAMNDLFNAYLKEALIRRGNKIKRPDGRNKFSDIYDYTRKKYKVSYGIPFWLLAIIGDLFPIAVIGAANEARKKTTEKQQ
jgi:hypothetical protein